MLRVHNPPNLNLPPLMVQKTEAREEMENSPKIANFIRSNLLLRKDFYELSQTICDLSGKIQEMITSFSEVDDPKDSGMALFRAMRNRGREDWERLRLIRNLLAHRPSGAKLSKADQKALDEVRSGLFKDTVATIKRHSTTIQNKLSAYESQHQINLDILTPITLYLCRKCNKLISTDRFSTINCKCGEHIEDVSKTRREPLAYFDGQLQSFMKNNYWFEHGIDYLLRRKNFQTLCGVHVLGHSGNLHEIDNIAESKSANFRFFCECKTAAIKTNEVFVLAGKMADTGCSKGYIFTLDKDTPKEIRHLGRSRNISIVGEALGRTEESLLTEIRDE